MNSFLRNLSTSQQIGALFIVMFGVLSLATLWGFAKTLREHASDDPLADARTQEAAQAFLNTAAHWADGLPHRDDITLYPAVPLTIQRVANVERAQLLVETHSRAALQRFLGAWQPVLYACRSAPEARGLVRWAVDVDPLTV